MRHILPFMNCVKWLPVTVQMCLCLKCLDVGNIAGTNAYWNRVREDLKAIITSVGAPTLFFTFSSADMHWPELHALFKADTDSEIGHSASEVRRQNVINNPHIVDWFFTQKIRKLYKTLAL